MAVNIGGVQNVVDACRAAGVRRLVHTSSFHAHEQAPLDKPLDESRPLVSGRKHPPYNYSKAQGEGIVRNAMGKGLDAVIVNPGGMLGPYDFKPSHFGETILLMARGKLPALVDAGLCWVDIRDVAEGMITAAEAGERRKQVPSHRRWVTLKDIARQVGEATGINPPAIVLLFMDGESGCPGGGVYR
jgi:dihydroflavonol-4-reductase